MRIAIDARMYQESGIGRYIRNLIQQLMILDKENEYFIFLLKKEYRQINFPGGKFHKVLANFKWYGFSEQVNMLKILNEIKPDLVHFPHFNIPVFYKGKFVVTIHDLIHQHFEMKRVTTLGPITYKIKQLGYRTIFKTAVKNSEHVLVPSDNIKKGLISEWGIEKDKVTVTLEAVDDKILEIVKRMDTKKITKVMDKFNIESPYIFYVGNAHPHKNVEGLIKAFLQIKNKYPDLNLILSGYDHYFWRRLKSENLHKGIIYTDYINDEELVALYKNAVCFVMPSFEEGFGIPILESFALFCPVVSSNAGALLEIGGNSAIFFDPRNIQDMVDKISLVLNSEKIRKELIKKGKERVKLFSWNKLAKQTLEVYRSCV